MPPNAVYLWIKVVLSKQLERYTEPEICEIKCILVVAHRIAAELAATHGWIISATSQHEGAEHCHKVVGQ